ncbi:hypothetical protein BXY70_2100 [Roseovarius halotolerans]|uniref:Uncharacterized protein n=1 Tax=Roseovarius halotolerans TaxID=505353 RepID=A0A1X6YX42_9RHOB|nr:hypothetical protein [Roseovarius halotolerans]RKT32752.1 hypothetical protein BXY70_2100 [Roseovarius halotolerans]SLN33322.1 hypothetical protein ROH8110_01605 [Roseovarius halotolerans]
MTDSEDQPSHHSMAEGRSPHLNPSETTAPGSRIGRLRARLPGLEVVLLVIAILMIAVALPLEAGTFPFSESSSAKDD